MIRDNMVAALLQERVSETGVAMREAISFLMELCRDGMSDIEIGNTLDRLSPMMRHELIDGIRGLALKIGIALPQVAIA